MSSEVDKLTAASVLLVDDEPHILDVFSSYLMFCGFQVTTAHDGEEALKALHETLPDIVVLDIRMPVMDGWAVCKRIKSSPQTAHLPVIFLSAFDQAVDHERACSLGVQGYLAKPCEPAELVNQICRCLRLPIPNQLHS